MAVLRTGPQQGGGVRIRRFPYIGAGRKHSRFRNANVPDHHVAAQARGGIEEMAGLFIGKGHRIIRLHGDALRGAGIAVAAARNVHAAHGGGRRVHGGGKLGRRAGQAAAEACAVKRVHDDVGPCNFTQTLLAVVRKSKRSHLLRQPVEIVCRIFGQGAR